MKKIISIALVFMMLIPMSFSIQADEFEELPVDPLDKMLDDMDEDVYAGTYIDADGNRCITVADETSANQKFAGARNVDLDEDIVIEEV